MRIVFMGTPEFAATILEDLVQHHEVLAVYTRPDAVRGRGKIKESSPVKKTAEQLGIPVFSPISLCDQAVIDHTRQLEPDVICVAAYGALLPSEILSIPRHGCLNVHASLLPRWRGAAPIERAILSDDEETGVCIMIMEEGLDTGDYCICRTAYIEDKTFVELSDELANLGSQALLTALVHIEEGAVEWTQQEEATVTYAAKVEKRELNIDPHDTARTAVLKVRASSDAHPSRCVLADRTITLLEVSEIREDDPIMEHIAHLQPGETTFVHKRLCMGVKDGVIEVHRVKPDGKKSMDAKSFAAGIQNIKNNILGWN